MHLLPPDGKWNIEFNIDWTDWDTVDALTFQSATPLPAFQLNWRGSLRDWRDALSGEGLFRERRLFLSETQSLTGISIPSFRTPPLHVISFMDSHKENAGTGIGRDSLSPGRGER